MFSLSKYAIPCMGYGVFIGNDTFDMVAVWPYTANVCVRAIETDTERERIA